MICCASAPEAAKTASREARISLFILLIIAYIFACDLQIGTGFRRFAQESYLNRKRVREIVKGYSL